MGTVERLVDRVRAAGGKVTPQRLYLFRALAETATHPTAEELYERLRADLPTTSLGTVYKILGELVELGEVGTVECGDGRCRYDPRTSPHAHLICRSCGRIEDAGPEVVRLDVPAEVDGFLVTGQRLVLDGLCATCRMAGSSDVEAAVGPARRGER